MDVKAYFTDDKFLKGQKIFFLVVKGSLYLFKYGETEVIIYGLSSFFVPMLFLLFVYIVSVHH
jgi:hypothetical protein